VKRELKQVDLLRLERAKRSGCHPSGRGPSFFEKHWLDIIGVLVVYGFCVYALGWIVPTLLFGFMGVIAWAVSDEEGRLK